MISITTARWCSRRCARDVATSAPTRWPRAAGFVFYAEGVEMGAEAPFAGQELRVDLPRPAEVRLLADGEEVAAANGAELAHRAERAGGLSRRGLPRDLRAAADLDPLQPHIPPMIEVRLDPALSLREQPALGHNRWHPALAPVASVSPGDELWLDLRDSMDGEVARESTDEDLLSLPAISHVLTGPVAVEGAEPGDLLELEILGYETAGFGWTAVLPGYGPARRSDRGGRSWCGGTRRRAWRARTISRA